MTGAAGQVGGELCRCPPPGVEVIGLARSDLDVTDAVAVAETIGRFSPDLVVHAAAWTAVDAAEADEPAALAVNAGSAGSVAAAAAAAGARLLHLSTDYVFTGRACRPYRPEASPAPRGAYGRSKLEGERRVLATAPGRALVVRTSWVYAARGHNFVRSVLARMAAGEPLEVVDDQVGRPTWARSLAGALWAAAARPDLHGVLHWADAGVASWYDLAVAVLEEALALGLLDRAVPIRPIPTTARPTPAPRPAYSVLDTRASAASLDLRPDHWRSSLRRMLAELAAVGGAP